MAVNNYAPAEYGGYVLGVNGGGGGGESSPFDEMLGITGYAEVTYNFTLPGDYQPSTGDADVEITILEDPSQDYAFEADIRVYVNTDSITLIVNVPLRENYTTMLKINAVDCVNGYYYIEEYTSVEGGVEVYTNNNSILVTGDGVVNATLIAD